MVNRSLFSGDGNTASSGSLESHPSRLIFLIMKERIQASEFTPNNLQFKVCAR